MDTFVLAARKALGMTQEELGGSLGVSQPTISRYETNPEEVDERTKLAIRGLCAQRRVKPPSEVPLP